MATRTTSALRTPTDGRLRAGWRIVIPLIAVMAGLVVVDFTVVAPLAGTPAAQLAAAVGRIVIGVGVIAVTARLLDRRRLRDYGLRADGRWWLDLTVGAAIGIVMFGVSTAIGVAAGWLEVDAILSPAAVGGLWLMLGLAVIRLAAVSLWEELLFRGVMIKNAVEGLVGRWSTAAAVAVAVTISTVVFALIHVPQHLGAAVVPMPQLLVMWLAMGGLLAAGYVLTGQLALPLGLHLTINLALQHVFVLWGDLAADAATVLRFEVVGPEALAGTGGWLQLGAVALGYVLLLGWIRWRHGPLRVHTSLGRPPARAVEAERARGSVSEAAASGDRR